MVLSWFGTVATQVRASDDTDFFENRIRPILAARCNACHSDAVGKTSGGLALDTQAGWMKGGDSGQVIVPGKPDESLLISAVRYEEGGLQMPPPNKGVSGKLTEQEIASLVEWVRRGAHDPRTSAEKIGGMSALEAKQWWSFQPLQAIQPPAVQNSLRTQAEIDQFILQQLEQHSLTPSGAADKRTLIRRATFDLTGLPPTPAEIAEFLADESQDAFSKLVDRILASPAYGERWGRHWLDVARYADTAGDGADYPVREARKYRDWVIRAFNKDQPFDQFVREQIAGDIIAANGPAELYADRVTATGFLAIGKRYGYSPKPDYQHLDFADTIDSVGRSLLGLSIGCARCHDHKYDPVTAADYYALYGIFQSTKWAFPGGEEHKRPTYFPPLVPPDQAKKLEQAKVDQLQQLEMQLSRLKSERATLDGKSFAGGVDLAFEGQAPGKPPGSPWLSVGPNVVLTDAQSPFTHIHPSGNQGVRLGTGLATEGIRYVFENGLRAVAGRQMHFTIDFRTVKPADKTGAYRFYLGRGVIASLAVECSVTASEFAIKNGTQWEVIRQIVPGNWYTLRLTLDPDKKTFSGVIASQDELTPFQDKGLGPNWDGVADTFICDGFGHVDGPAAVRDLDNLGLQEKPFGIPGSGPVVAQVMPEDAKDRLTKLDAEIADITKKRDQITASELYEVVYGVSEGTPTNARIQKRGEPEKPGDEVPRRFLEILGGDTLPANSQGSGRLELANWVTRPTNPLTARVYVNRVWQWHFGHGLVSTASDFGSRGERPSHPELLDWLTSEFIKSGWSVKSLNRLIMRSQTYQQVSDDHSANLAKDPGNKWLWRFPRRALDAESIRDAMLAISGQLDRSIPPDHPFPPVNTWGFTIHNPFHAVYDHDHRSVYLMVQRNRRHPFLALFDAADPNLSVAERQPTTTPTQTLYLMNSPFVHQQSALFASKLFESAAEDSARIGLAFEMTHGRIPSSAETAQAIAFLQAYEGKLAEQGIVEKERKMSAWSALGRILLTSNGFLYVD